eukprot:1142337-Pelagomonas_calceolata.AAC.2
MQSKESCSFISEVNFSVCLAQFKGLQGVGLQPENLADRLLPCQIWPQYFNSCHGAGSQSPTVRYGEDQLANSDSLNIWACILFAMFAATERVAPTFHAGCLSERQFASEHGLVDRLPCM